MFPSRSCLELKRERRRPAPPQTFTYYEFLVRTMLCGVMFGRFFRVVSGMQMVTVGDVGMMSGLFMATTGVAFGRFFMMARCVFVMFCCFCMMFCALLSHRGFEV